MSKKSVLQSRRIRARRKDVETKHLKIIDAFNNDPKSIDQFSVEEISSAIPRIWTTTSAQPVLLAAWERVLMYGSNKLIVATMQNQHEYLVKIARKNNGSVKVFGDTTEESDNQFDTAFSDLLSRVATYWQESNES